MKKHFLLIFTALLMGFSAVESFADILPTSIDGNLTVNKKLTPISFTSNNTKEPRAFYFFGIKKTGSLPPGLTLNQLGVLSGVPKVEGNFTFTVEYYKSNKREVHDSSPPITIRVVKASPPTITTTSPLSPGQMDVPYVQGAGGVIFQATGGIPFLPTPDKPTGYNWSLSAGKIPPGMTFNTVGALSGIPRPNPKLSGNFTQPQTFTFNITATDAVLGNNTKTFSLTINPPVSPTIVTDCPLPEGLERFSYPLVFLKATSGKKEYKWSVGPSTSPLPTGAINRFPDGLTLSLAGAISGKPTLRGLFVFRLKVTDSNGMSVEKECRITIRPAPEFCTDKLFICARVGDDAGCFQVCARGGDQPYTWSQTGLPPGLTINSTTGKICGNFTQAGNFTANITVSEASVMKGNATKSFEIVVKPQLEITTISPLAFGIVGRSYPYTSSLSPVKIEAIGGWPSYRWTVILGKLPDGLVLDPSSGIISGTPTKKGPFKFTVRVQDSCDNPFKVVDKEFVITIYDPLEIVDTSILQCHTINKTISPPFCLTAKGGLPAYEWKIVSGSLAGLILNNSTGCISGTITDGGNKSVTIQVIDQNGVETQKSFDFRVYDELIITSACPLVFGTNGTAYTANLTAEGGSSPYTWSIPTPSLLPTGLTLNSTTGRISGTPRVTGNLSFSYKVTDACSNNATKNCTIAIYEPLKITKLPLFTCKWVGDDDGCFQAEATGGAPTYTWNATTPLPPTLTINETTGEICGNFTQAGNFSTIIRVTDKVGTIAEGNFTSEVTAPLAITTTCPLPDGKVAQVYSITLNATGGKEPYTWQILPQIYVSDFNNHRIQKFTESGTVTTYAGQVKVAGSLDGNKTTEATFNNPYGMGFDPHGNIYVADFGTSRIRKISSSGEVSTPAGTSAGYLDGNKTTAKFSQPEDMVADKNGNIYVADYKNHLIRKIDNSGNVTTLAGNYVTTLAGNFEGVAGFSDGNGTAAKFNAPQGICWNLDGDMLLADYSNGKIRKITTNGNVTTVAKDLNSPHDVKVDSLGNIYVIDQHLGPRIAKISMNGTLTDLTRNCTGPNMLSVDRGGFVYVSNTIDHTIEKITPSGNLTKIAGKGGAGTLNGPVFEAMFDTPKSVEINPYEDLPLGLTLNSTTGKISGTPKAHGLYNLTYQVTDSCGNKVISNCTMTIASNKPEFAFELPWKLTDEGAIAVGHDGSKRNYTSATIPAGGLWSVEPDNLTLKVFWENSLGCPGGSNPNTQSATATINMTTTVAQKIGLDWVGIGELEAPNFEKMQVYIDGNLIGSAQAAGGNLDCAMGPVISVNHYPAGYVLPAGNHIISITATTNDGAYHVGAYYQFSFTLVE